MDLINDGHMIRHEHFSSVVLQLTNHQTSYYHDLNGSTLLLL
jgi:hypothetical protein